MCRAVDTPVHLFYHYLVTLTWSIWAFVLIPYQLLITLLMFDRCITFVIVHHSAGLFGDLAFVTIVHYCSIVSFVLID